MNKHYSYRVDHDVGFAPNVQGDICTVCGCKSSTVEQWVTVGSFVVGLGGVGTGRPNSLLYAMRVDATPKVAEFMCRFPRRGLYLRNSGIPLTAPVLFSRSFYYVGDHSIPIPAHLQRIIIPAQGCKRLTDSEVIALEQFLSQHYGVGMHGHPNNAPNAFSRECACSC